VLSRGSDGGAALLSAHAAAATNDVDAAATDAARIAAATVTLDAARRAAAGAADGVIVIVNKCEGLDDDNLDLLGVTAEAAELTLGDGAARPVSAQQGDGLPEVCRWCVGRSLFSSRHEGTRGRAPGWRWVAFQCD